MPAQAGVGTNHPSSLARASYAGHAPPNRTAPSRVRITDARTYVLRRPGGYGEETPPDPIPNSAVKILSADGTASQGAGE